MGREVDGRWERKVIRSWVGKSGCSNRITLGKGIKRIQGYFRDLGRGHERNVWWGSRGRVGEGLITEMLKGVLFSGIGVSSIEGREDVCYNEVGGVGGVMIKRN